MKKITVDGKKIVNLYDIHVIFKKEMNFPPWYGKNLDALFDCLTDVREDTLITFENEDALFEKLGNKYPVLLEVISAASNENPHIKTKQ